MAKGHKEAAAATRAAAVLVADPAAAGRTKMMAACDVCGVCVGVSHSMWLVLTGVVQCAVVHKLVAEYVAVIHYNTELMQSILCMYTHIHVTVIHVLMV